MIWGILRRLLASRVEVAPSRVPDSEFLCPREYRALHVYLRGRFAGLAVLTFNDIESLLGRSLPEQARKDAAWWNAADLTAGEPRHALAWTLANRSATANLLAGTVAFERSG